MEEVVELDADELDAKDNVEKLDEETLV